MSAFIMQQQALRQQAQSAGLLEAYPLDPEVPSSTVIPSGFSAAFLAHLENVGKDGTAASVAASSDAALDSPEKPRSAQSSLLSWQPVSADDIPQAVCVVKRFRASAGVAQVCPVEARSLLQAHPKAHVTRSRSPPRPLQQREISGLQLPADRVDHRHRLGLGSRLAPTLSPRSAPSSLRPSPKPGNGPALPMPKHRAAFYAKHTRAPSRGLAASAMLGPSCKSEGAPAATGLRSPVLPQASQLSGMQVSVSAGTGLTLQQGVHQQQFEDVRQLWSSIKPLLLPFSVVLQDLEVSSHAGELEIGLLRTVSEVTALRYLRTLHKFLLQLDELWNLSWDMASQAVTVDCILLSSSEYHQGSALGCKALPAPCGGSLRGALSYPRRSASLRQVAPRVVSFTLEAGQLPGARAHLSYAACAGITLGWSRLDLCLWLLALVGLTASPLGVLDVFVILSACPGVQDKDISSGRASSFSHFRGSRFGFRGSPNLACALP